MTSLPHRSAKVQVAGLQGSGMGGLVVGVVGGKGRGKGGEGREDFAGSPSRDPWEGETWLLDGSYRTGLGPEYGAGRPVGAGKTVLCLRWVSNCTSGTCPCARSGAEVIMKVFGL